jgi:ComF family protein
MKLPLVEEITDILAPARCIGCLQEGTWHCAACEQKLPPTVTACIVCEALRPRGTTCQGCRTKTALTGVISAGMYHNMALRRGIHWLKFKGVRPLAAILAGALIPHLSLIAPLSVLQRHAVLVPIPIHSRRFRERGFNQSFDIAQRISHLTHIPMRDLLVRTRATWTQTLLPADLRGDNMRDAFNVLEHPETHIRFVLIVDDVTTSGATLSAAAAAIAPAARPFTQFWGCTIARG